MEKEIKTNEELLAWRADRIKKIEERYKIVTENFVVLCRLIENEEENFRIETPFGDIIFYPKSK